MQKKWTIEQMQELASENGGKCLSEKYVNSRSHLEWVCEEGHNWKASASSVKSGRWCKICFPSNTFRPCSKKFTDSASSQLLLEWALDLNKLSPDQFSSQSKRKVYWRCSLNHVWQATVQARTRGTGCPECFKRDRGDILRIAKLKKSGTSFAKKYPYLLSEWDYEKNEIDPNKVAPHSNIKVFWRCKHNHSFKASIDNRTLGDSGCPYCSSQTSRLEIFILCELRSIFKEVIWRRKFDGVEADIFLNTEQIAIEVDGEYWHKDKIELDKKKSKFFEKLGIKLVRIRSSLLPSIKGLQILYSKNKDEFEIVVELFELLTKEIDNLNLQQYLLDKVRKGEDEYKEITSRLPAPPEEKSLAFLYPNLIKEWDYQKNAPLTPDLFSAGSNLKAWWVCFKNHSWESTIKNRTGKNSGCPDCHKDRLIKIRKQAIKEIMHYAKINGGTCDTSNYINSSNGNVQWTCSENHTWNSRYDFLVKKGKWCPICDRIDRFAPKRINSINKINAYAKSRGGSCDTTNFINMNSKIPWRCANGHRWVASASMLKNNTWCKYCK
jgi:hypothetical protein